MKPATHLALEVTEKQDKSPKGTIDIPILPFMAIINQTLDYKTTSSCSGRIVLWCNKTTKHQGSWLFVTHDQLPLENDSAFEQLFSKAESVQFITIGDIDTSDMQLLYYKFEPFILHVESSSYEKAQELFTKVYNLGWRNSGLIPSKKHLVIIKSTLKLDVPIGYFCPTTKTVYLIVQKEYMNLLIELGREKFQENEKRMNVLLHSLQSDLEP